MVNESRRLVKQVDHNTLQIDGIHSLLAGINLTSRKILHSDHVWNNLTLSDAIQLDCVLQHNDRKGRELWTKNRWEMVPGDKPEWSPYEDDRLEFMKNQAPSLHRGNRWTTK
jgi:hypothetical protein